MRVPLERKPMKAIGFFYCWNGRRELDGYFGQFAQAFAALGITLEIILADELRHPDGSIYSFNPLVEPSKLIGFVNAFQPDFIFSINNAGMTARLERETDAPILKWLVDDIPHLFFHDGAPAPGRAFAGRERIICYSSTLAGQIEAAYPHTAGRVGFVSHGTDLAGKRFEQADAIYPISFVGSCLDHRELPRLLHAARKHGAADQVLAALEALRTDYVSGFDAVAATPELVRALADIRYTWLDFKRMLSDVLTVQDRMQGLLRIADLGLHLFGNELWLDSLCCTPDLAARFQFDNPVDSYDKLLAVYARSKIAINIPNVQNQAGLAARVFDIMASPSLLITQAHPDSDLFRLFGADCPVPMYRDFDHLRELCSFYLDNEEERLRIVAQCNRLVDARFLPKNRLAAMLDSAGIERPAAPAGAAALPEIVPTSNFHAIPRSLERLGPWAKTAARQSLKWTARAARKVVPDRLR